VSDVTYLTPDELCARLRGTVKPKTLANWRRGDGGTGPRFTRIGNRILYALADVLEWEAQRTFAGSAQYSRGR